MGIRRQALLAVAGLAPSLWAARVQRPIFILGTGRSGTTLLNNILAQHRDIATLSEANDIWDPSGYPWHDSPRESPPLWVDPYAYTERWWRDAQPRQKEIKAVFGAYQTVRMRSSFMNKSPMNTFRIPHLLQMFPQALFVNIVRDGRAVVQSYLPRVMRQIELTPEIFGPFDISLTHADVGIQLAIFWKQNVDEVVMQDKIFNLTASGRLINITYEQLCADMRGTIERVCSGLGLDAARFHPSAWQTQLKNQNHKWQKAFSPDFAQQLSAAMQPTLREAGYIV